jgi:hypothetical protein
MKNLPVLDKSIIAEWSYRHSELKRSTRRFLVGWFFMVSLLAVPPIVGWVKLYPYWVLAGFGAFFVLAARMQFSSFTIQCPNCGNPPVAAWQRTPLWQIDHCSSCNYWLLDPRRGNGT